MQVQHHLSKLIGCQNSRCLPHLSRSWIDIGDSPLALCGTGPHLSPTCQGWGNTAKAFLAFLGNRIFSGRRRVRLFPLLSGFGVIDSPEVFGLHLFPPGTRNIYMARTPVRVSGIVIFSENVVIFALF